jgi:magnesium transporter
MLHRHTHGDLVWVDVVSPTQEEVRSLMEEFHLDPLIADELLAPSVRNRVDAREDYFYLVLHFPAFKHLHDVSGVALELDFVVGKKWIITTRYEAVDPLHDFSKIFEMDSVLDRQNMGEHAGFVFYYMLAEIYRTLSDELTHIGVRLDAAEDRVFHGYEREMVIELSHISRDLLNYSQALDTHSAMLQSIETPGVALFGYEYARNLRSIIGEYERLASAIKSSRASLVELRETNNSLLTTKQNEIMKVFTIMAFVTYPLTLISSAFGMNTVMTPIVGHQFDFWIIVGIMLSAAVTFFAFFKYKRWL